MVLLKFFTLSLFLSLTVGQEMRENPEIHVQDFIAAYKKSCDENIKEYDSRIESFKDLYNGRVGTIHTQKDSLLAVMQRSSDRLAAFELLSDVTKECVNQHRLQLSLTKVKDMLVACYTTADSQLEELLAPVLQTRNALSSYYDEILLQEFEKCITPSESQKTSEAEKIIDCLKDVVSISGAFTVSNRKTFDFELDAANCSGNTYIKMALDCSFVAQSTTIALITATNVMIDRCSQSASECTPCERKLACENVHEIPANLIDYANQTMTNPFYNSNETISCMTINLV